MDVADLGEKEGWYGEGFDRSGWATVTVPKAWDLHDQAFWGYEGIGWYTLSLKGRLTRPASVQWLRFARVNYHTRVMRKLIKRARELDGSRLVTFVTDRDARAQKAYEDADLVAINVYQGQFSEKIAHHISQLEELVRKPTEDRIRQQLVSYPDKPFIVTEFGTRGVPTVHGDVHYTEEFQAAFIQAAWKAMQSIDELSGGVLWCWADYYHRRNFIQYAVFGPYGVVTVDRKPKAALRALATMYGGSAGTARRPFPQAGVQ